MSNMFSRRLPAWKWLLFLSISTVGAYNIKSGHHLTRRQAIIESVAAASALGSHLCCPQSVVADVDESRLILPVETSKGISYTVSVPRIGYSLYKTEVEQVPQCVELALLAGVQHFDVGSQYGSNKEIGKVIKAYLLQGLEGVPDQPNTKLERRQHLFISHKVSNDEQSTSSRNVKMAVKKQLKLLGVEYLDLCSVHSPLTDQARRLTTYGALMELQDEGIVKTVGVCNYGVKPLQEMTDAGMLAPSVNQLILSPFNQHKDVVKWTEQQRTVLGCNAWSKLSSAQGPQDGWAVLADIGKSKGMTKAQVLVRWAFQKGYLCVPRSGSKYKIERAAIAETSYRGTKDFVLSEKEMNILDGLDEKLSAGRLGILDGWTEADIESESWDPTFAV